MATNTKNYNLKKSDKTDFYNVDDSNGNMDILDTKLKEVEDKSGVTGVKGSNEETYRNGNVELSKDNIGLSNVENKSSETIRSEITSTNVTTALGYTPMNSTLKGASNGVAELDETGKVPSTQLPSYVDDVLEYASRNDFPNPGESGKIYVDKSKNLTYRWGGSDYVLISESLALGETEQTAYRGDRGKIAYNHSQTAHAPADAQANVIEEIKVNGTAKTPTNKSVNINVPDDLHGNNYTIPAGSWTLNASTNYFEHSVSNSNITENTFVDVVMDIPNQQKLSRSSILSYNGGFKVITSVEPTDAISITYTYQLVSNEG